MGIEFLGACRDAHPFNEPGHSGTRFRSGLNDYMAKVDPRYAQYDRGNNVPYDLYTFLRCGMAHIIRPTGHIGVTGRGNGTTVQHLQIEPTSQKLILIADNFCNDFCAAATILVGELPTMPDPTGKLQGAFLPVVDV